MSRFALAVVFALLAIAFVRPQPSSGSAGEMPNLTFPFPEGQTWVISKGYACNPPAGDCHPADKYPYALDFTRPNPVDAYGQPVRAAAAGIVSSVHFDSELGWRATVNHGGGYVTFYAHLQAVGIAGSGTAVAQGQRIGWTGCTGNCADPHIHFAAGYVPPGELFFDSIQPEPICGHTGFLPGQTFTNCFPDADGDGVRNELDNCPGAAEDRDLYEDQDGCAEPEPDEGLNGDFNGDGRDDVAHICCDAWIHIWLSNGNGTYNITTFDPPGAYNVQSGSWRTGDFDGDGKTDLIHLCCSNYVHVWFSNGDGSFNVTQFIPPGGSYGVQLGSWRVGDANGDGKTDIFHFCCSTYIHTWLSNGDGTFTTPIFGPPGSYQAQLGTWRTGDVNADGKTDLIHLCCPDYIHTWISNGDGSYNVTQFIPPGGGSYAVQVGSIYVGDANGDGRSDLFHICCDTYIHTWLSNGNGTYNVTQFVYGSFPILKGTWKTGDTNGNGRTDLIQLCCATYILTWLSNGSGGYTVSQENAPAPLTGSWRVADVNSDGRSDLVHRCCPGYINTWLSLGGGDYNVTQFSPGGAYDVQAGRFLTGDYAPPLVQSPVPTPTPTPLGQTPTPTPVGQTPSPTPIGQTPSPTPTPTPVGQTPTPTPVGQIPTPTPIGQTPTATPTPGANGHIQGDNDCDGDSDAVDALVSLQNNAGLDPNQQPGCPELGGALPAGGAPPLFGDIDCDGDVDAVDALQILRNVAGLPVNQQQGCPAIGQALT